MKKTAFFRSIATSILGVTVFVFALVSNDTVYASTFSRDIKTTVEVLGPQEVQVTQTQRLNWDNSRVYFPAEKNFAYAYIFPVYEHQLATLQQRVRGISVQSDAASTRSLPFTTSISDGALQVKIPYYENLSDDNELVFTVSYKTDLYVLSEGGILEVAYPGLSKDFKTKTPHEKEGYDEVTSYGVTFLVPASVGEIASVYPVPTSQKNVNKRTTITYGASALVGKSVKIITGKERRVKFVLSGNTYATNLNTPDFVKDMLVNFVDVALPTQQVGTEFSNQTILYSKIEPFPTKLWVDADGNLIARFPVSAAQEGKITIEGYAIIRKGEVVATLPNELISSIPASFEQYLKPEPLYWQSDNPVIQEAAKGITDVGNRELSTLKQALAFVSNKLSYPGEIASYDLQRLGAVKALEKKVGVCMEYSDLLLSLLRAKKIPARAVYGDGLGSRVDRTLEGIGHQWVGVWFPGHGWVPVDPTWSDEGPELIGHDFDHLVWYVASTSANEPSGFNCQSWDATSPCKEALRIETTPVDILPPETELMTITQLQEKVAATQSSESSNIVVKSAQNVVTYLGESRVGRILLSKQGMLIAFALILYFILLFLVTTVTKMVRKARMNAQKTVSRA
jgi:hypothetical protein